MDTAANFLKEKGIKDTLYGSVGGDVWVKGGLSALIDEFATKSGLTILRKWKLNPMTTIVLINPKKWKK